jgi:hypothetical protein
MSPFPSCSVYVNGPHRRRVIFPGEGLGAHLRAPVFPAGKAGEGDAKPRAKWLILKCLFVSDTPSLTSGRGAGVLGPGQRGQATRAQQGSRWVGQGCHGQGQDTAPSPLKLREQGDG